MISYAEALNVILQQGSRFTVESEKVPLNEICGRICAEDIKSPRANQPFDNSAMDGFAVIADDLQGAVNDNPVTLTIAGHLAAGGGAASSVLSRGHCYEIMTGAPVPGGADAVVPVEKVRKDATGHIVFQASVRRGENIRRAGADFMQGDPVLSKGDMLHAGHILALATLGISEVNVLSRLKVGVISTGMEVVDDLTSGLGDSQIFNSTGPYLRTVLPQMGADILHLGTVPDDAEKFRAKVIEAQEQGCNVILSTGAVSAGVHDFVPSVIKSMGAEIFFHKVAIRPGKPVFFARLSGGSYFVGLPGNPVSTAAGLRFFVQPLFRSMLGLLPETPAYAVVAEDYGNLKAGLRFFLRARLDTDATGKNVVCLIKEQQSFMVKPFTQSDVWVCAPEDAGLIKKGDVVAIYQ